MRATIFLRDLSLRALIGVRPRERRRRQPLVVDISLEVELGALGREDRLESTVDYSALHDRVVTLVEGSSYALIETLAHRVAMVCLEDTRVAAAVVTVRKPHALAYAESAGVTVRMDREAGPHV